LSVLRFFLAYAGAELCGIYHRCSPSVVSGGTQNILVISIRLEFEHLSKPRRAGAIFHAEKTAPKPWTASFEPLYGSIPGNLILKSALLAMEVLIAVPIALLIPSRAPNGYHTRKAHILCDVYLRSEIIGFYHPASGARRRFIRRRQPRAFVCSATAHNESAPR
jgi:hypothetical protein